MILLLRRQTLLTILMMGAFLLGCLWLFRREKPAPAMESTLQETGNIIILDAGHGGADGGAVAADGTTESGINLAITRDAEALFRFLGQETVLTRTDENGLYNEDSVTIRQKKVADTRNRVQLINSYANATLLSIHQNALPSAPKTRGAQVFYNGQQHADETAERIQRALNQSVNSTHPKSTAAISKNVYIMSHAECPAVLVECGFLSNAEEATLLRQENYQKKLAVAIVCGCLNDKE